jgi:NADPH-dependent 2,4-dienoyl-CoA reductase/sulfur reductase-like enzyme
MEKQMRKFSKNDDAIRKLPPDQYLVTQQNGTEAPGTGEYLDNKERVSYTHLPRVVIVGGGFGGLYAAFGLARAPVTVTVVDKHNYHLFRPMLYQVATGLLSSDEVAAPIRSILRREKERDGPHDGGRRSRPARQRGVHACGQDRV